MELNARRRVMTVLGFVTVFLVAVAFRGWAATEWAANFDSDEAVFGLMAKHIAEGEYVPTVYGTRHLGSIESYLAALNFLLFKVDVVPFRAATLLLMALFFAAHAWYVHRRWGAVASLASLVFVAVPGFHILSWTFQPIGAYAALLLLGTLILILAEKQRSEPRGTPLRILILGLVSGLGLWANQMIIAYMIAAAFTGFLCSAEWKRLRGGIAGFVRERIGIRPAEVAPMLVLGLGALGVAGFFSGGCNPAGQFQHLGQFARAALVLVGAGVGFGMLLVSQRRSEILVQGSIGAAGFIIGYAPLWMAWVTDREQPVGALLASCPTGTLLRARLLAYQILPEMAGVRSFGTLRDAGGLAIVGSGAILLLTVLAVGWFVWRYRRDFWSMLTWRPAEEKGGGESLTVGILLLLPLALSVLSSNTIDIHSIRHLVVAWQAMAVVLGLWLVRLPRIPAGAKVTVILLWTGYLGLSNIEYARAHWPAKFTRFDREATEQLEAHLVEQGISAGFADYWGAFALDFLLQERVILAPYNGLDRIPEYSARVRDADRVAFVFPLTRRPMDGLSLESLRQHLALENPVSGEGPAAGWIQEALTNFVVESREAVAAWDVWILRRK